jgi:hypothetical protein
MCRKLLLVIVIFSIVSNSQVYGQQFVRHTMACGLLHQYSGSNYGGGVSFYDFNKDGWDDLSLPDDNLNCRFFRNNGDGTLEMLPPLFPAEEGEKVKQINWVDFDNDGDADLSLSTYQGRFRLYKNDGNFSFSEIAAISGFPDAENETFGHSWGDYNRDGWLDVYICNYDYFDTDITNYLYRNNGDGSFSDVSLETGTDNGSNFSFIGVFGDYNNDGWSDLFVINDRTYSRDYMYRNNGGTFSDETEILNLDYFIYSMSNSWADYDNDGDFDIYITNGMAGNLLHRNENVGEYFTEVAVQAGVVQYDFSFAANWLDYDLDGWLDLQVCVKPFWLNPGQNRFYRNNGDGSFTNLTENIGIALDQGRWSHGASWGDLNNDGHPDYCVNNDYPYLSDLWLNTGNSGNNYLKISLEGVVSNRDGIGSLIELWANGMSQRRYTMIGESYLSQPSPRNIFGIGQSEMVDSIRISWLSGHVDRFYDISANQTLHITEGSSVNVSLNHTGIIPLCTDSVVLETSGFSSYIWSDGSIGSSLEISEPGAYWVEAFTAEGISVLSDTIFVVEAEIPDIESIISNPICSGSSDGMIAVTVLNPYEHMESQLLWSTGEASDIIDGLPAGSYSLDFYYGEGCIVSWDYELVDPDYQEPEITVEELLCYGDSNASISIENINGNGIDILTWDNGTAGTSLDELGPGMYSFQLIDTLGCLFEGEVLIDQPAELLTNLIITPATEAENAFAVIEVSGGLVPYEIYWSNQSTGESSGMLDPGDHWVQVIDAHGCDTSLYFKVEFIASIANEMNSDECFMLSPNPGKENVKLLSLCGREYSEIAIYSFEGKLLTRLSAEGRKEQILPLNNLPVGIYLVVIPESGTRLLYLACP